MEIIEENPENKNNENMNLSSKKNNEKSNYTLSKNVTYYLKIHQSLINILNK